MARVETQERLSESRRTSLTPLLSKGEPHARKQEQRKLQFHRRS